MQIQIISADSQNVTRLAVAEHKAGQAAVKHVVQPGQKITLLVDPAMLSVTEQSVTASTASTTPATINATPPTTNTGWLFAMLLALLGGMILNLMPCVFPILAMKAASLSAINWRQGQNLLMVTI